MQVIDFLVETDNRLIQGGLSVLMVLLYVFTTRLATSLIKKFGKRHGISIPRVIYTVKYFQFVTTIFYLLLLGIIWDISFEGLSVYFLSFFTVAGIGLFASWSILSNITAAIILFFYFPYRIGERIRIMDGDNSVEGVVFDLNIFSIVIKNDDGHKITYPNNLALQKGIVHIK